MKGAALLSAGRPRETMKKAGAKASFNLDEVRPFHSVFKSAFKNAAGLGSFSFLRWAERRLSIRHFYSTLKPFLFLRAAMNTVFKRPKSCDHLPVFLRPSKTIRGEIRQRTSRYLNHIVQFFPDRLAEAKWMGNCRIEGINHLQEARQHGRPVVLAFCHFGPYYLLRFWLRAAGFTAATFVGSKMEARMRLTRRQDRFSPHREIPVVLHYDQLRETIQFLSAGNPLLVALDGPGTKTLDVPFCEGWTFCMATGAARLASRHQAELIPCSIIDEGFWQFRIHLGPPVPKDYLASEADLPRAGTCLIQEMLPDFQARPEQCTNDLARCLKPSPRLRD